MGVRRAMEMVLAEANKKEGPLFTFGPLIHNNQVLELLSSKGVIPVEDLDSCQTGTIVIRAHGIPPQKRQAIKDAGFKVINATCPKVAKVHSIIQYHTRKGYSAVIVGDKDHAEVVGLMGYSKGPVHLIQSTKDVSGLPILDKVFVVAQTTQDEQNFHKVVKSLKKRFPGILVFNTICDATHHRQHEVRSFAGHVDAVVVVGGYHSGNTTRLVNVSNEAGLPTFHVETEKDLDRKMLLGMEVIGITAGASTPNWMIRNVVKEIEGMRSRRELPFIRFIKQTLKFLAVSNLLVASGAFCFSYSASILSEIHTNITFPFLAFLYIYAMHILNRFLDKGASVYNDPERAAFLRKNRRLLILTGVAAVATALALSLGIGVTTFIALTVISFLGIVYSIPIIPERLQHIYPYSKIKDIPGSRSLSESLAWVAIIVILPLFDINRIVWSAIIISTLVVFLMSYIRSALFDIFQVQGDMIVGTETLPITMGEKSTLVLLKSILLATAFILAVSPIAGLENPFSYVMLIPLFGLSLCLLAYEKRWLYPGINLEILVEGNFFLAGFLAVVWQVL